MFEEFVISSTEFLVEVAPYLISFVTGILVGSVAPTYYAAERLRGFGRAMFEKLPYKSPPGLNEEEALAKAANESEPEDIEEE